MSKPTRTLSIKSLSINKRELPEEATMAVRALVAMKCLPKTKMIFTSKGVISISLFTATISMGKTSNLKK